MIKKQKSLDYGALFKAMPIPRLIISIEDGKPDRVVQVSDQALKYFDCNETQILGRKIEDFMDIENARHFGQSFQVCIARKRTVTIQALPTIPGGLKVHGFWVSPMIENNEVAYIDVLGQIDVSDQSILQRERDDAISLLTSIFEVSEVGIIVSDENEKIVRVNNSFLRAYGWSRDDIIGANFSSLAAPGHREDVRWKHKKFISSGVRSTGEIEMLRKSGEIVNILFTSATLGLSHNRRYLITTVMDITERKKMEGSLRRAKEEAVSANHAKSTFLANMSHELRTPLNAIIGFSELMLKETFGPIENDKYKEYLDDVHMSAEHLLDIINEVLDMSKIEAGRIDLVEDEFDIQDVIVSVSRMLSSKVFASNIQIIRNIEEKLPPVRADYRLIRQVIINLITNAIKFSPQGSEIQVNAKVTEDQSIEISIIDEGIGIAEDKIETALEPFGQVSLISDKRIAQQQGTGLGLPLSKAMIEIHGGTFTLKSKLDAGTTIRFTIPADRVLDTPKS